MLDSITIAQLYENVLDSDMVKYNLTPEAIKHGIECMAHVYKPGEVPGLLSERSMIADYRDPAHRCAYLHKYAALHTAMVRDMLEEAIKENFRFFYKLVFSGSQFKLCCLGGGPGTDVIGALAALHSAFSYFDCAVNVVDYMEEWSYSFGAILSELASGWYGAFGNNVGHYLNWRYIGANLLKSFKPDVIDALSTASLVTMIKFTSAAACMDTSTMIKNIFAAMKPGAALLFIDNDGGGFHQLVKDAAYEFGFISIFGPLRRENYCNNFFNVKRFGYKSCFKTTVTVHVLQKPFIPYDNVGNLSTPYLLDNRPLGVFDENFPRRTSLLGSPPTPFIFNGPSNYINDVNRNVIFESNIHVSPPTPFIFNGPTNYIDENRNEMPLRPLLDEPLFSQDDNLYAVPGFSSPEEELPQSPRNVMFSRVATPLTRNIVNSPYIERPVIFTPNTQQRPGKRARQGCLPVRMRSFRHHIQNKLNQVKAQARAIFKKKNKKKKTHPIFRL